jgi:hypothetical protein
MRLAALRPSVWLPTSTLLALLLVTTTTLAQDPPRRPARAKPAQTRVDPARHYADRIRVKFHDGLQIRLRNGQLMDFGSGALGEAADLSERLTRAGAVWQRQHRLDEAKLEELRASAQRNLGKAVADLNTAFLLRLPAGMDAAATLDAFNALPAVQLAAPAPRPLPLPTPPNLETNQGYLDAATAGVDARFLWTVPGGTGAGVRIADVEYDWNLNHADLAATLVGPAGVDPFTGSANHGTAVLGVMGARRNGWGVTGIAYGSTFHVVAANTDDGFDLPGAISTALGVLRAGDVLVLEQQGMAPDPNPGLCPCEWDESVYDAIVTAVGNQVIVCEAAGNGAQNLDDPKFDDDHAPFLWQNDSGAIIVGAGAPPGHPEGDRARCGFSTYGYTVDLQGWGQWVVTTGYGDRYATEGTNYFYTAAFNGTSSATPVVAAACAVLQAAHKAAYGGAVLSPANIRAILRETGSPQLSGTHPATQNIGPRPNLTAALPLALATWVDFAYAGAEDGSFLQPFNTVPEGLAVVPAEGTINLRAGGTPWTGTISQNVTLRAYDGMVTVGQ